MVKIKELLVILLIKLIVIKGEIVVSDGDGDDNFNNPNPNPTQTDQPILHSGFDATEFRFRISRVNYMYCYLPNVTEQVLQEFMACFGPPAEKPDWVKKCEDDVFGSGWTLMVKRKKVCSNLSQTVSMLRHCFQIELSKKQMMISHQDDPAESFDARLIKLRRSQRSVFAGPIVARRGWKKETMSPEDREKLIQIIREITKKKMDQLVCQENALGIGPPPIQPTIPSSNQAD